MHHQQFRSEMNSWKNGTCNSNIDTHMMLHFDFQNTTSQLKLFPPSFTQKFFVLSIYC